MIANSIIAHIYLQPGLQQVDVAAMEKLVAEYPYFAAARLLLARKVYLQHSNLHETAVKKAMLYSGQPHHFYHIVTHEPILEQVEERIAPVIPEDSLPETPVDTAPQEPQEEETKEPVVPVSQPEELITTAPLPELEEVEERIAPVIPDDTLPEGREEEETVIPVIPDETVPSTQPEEPITTAPLPELGEVEERIAPVIPDDTLPEDSAAGSDETAATGDDTDRVLAEAEAILQRDTTVTADMLAVPETPHHTTATPEHTDNHTDTTEGALPIKIFPLEMPAEETTLTFQPLYTDDYFAYKRLKDPQLADELSEQGEAEMKSFTSWLRQIKDNFTGRSSKDWFNQQLHRLYEETEEPEISETVEKMAMNSITFNHDIVSETLAEIWVRQHQYQQAIRIYQKLSLLNPDKNAYFAQKIQELKSLIDKSKQ
ncbi:hypothetical protein [Chitinophaga flava]|uniref:Tetratricopeptide repeat protein n=1 Tax=Chitinophaga flava TaxID=2259036 RepID=A0A365Y1Z0_9BACT|nr:hypothetical protein [Chitinophaga flava]RBL91885.1 hypothetical protein DF182_04600 [Chitinophaga flava]